MMAHVSKKLRLAGEMGADKRRMCSKTQAAAELVEITGVTDSYSYYTGTCCSLALLHMHKSWGGW